MWILQFLPSKCNSASLWQPIKKKTHPPPALLWERCVSFTSLQRKRRVLPWNSMMSFWIENKKRHRENLHIHLHGNRTSGWHEQEVHKAAQSPRLIKIAWQLGLNDNDKLGSFLKQTNYKQNENVYRDNHYIYLAQLWFILRTKMTYFYTLSYCRYCPEVYLYINYII